MHSQICLLEVTIKVHCTEVSDLDMTSTFLNWSQPSLVGELHLSSTCPYDESAILVHPQLQLRLWLQCRVSDSHSVDSFLGITQQQWRPHFYSKFHCCQYAASCHMQEVLLFATAWIQRLLQGSLNRYLYLQFV